MIRGGDYYEWPKEYIDILLYGTQEDIMQEDKMLQEFNEYLWQKTLEDGPPQDEDTAWLKEVVWQAGYLAGHSTAKGKADSRRRKQIWNELVATA